MFAAKEDFSNVERLTIDKINDEGCINLLEMFLSQLSEDYHCVLIDFINNQANEKSRSNFKKARKFILSDYFTALTGIDGRDIIGTLDGEYKSALEAYKWAKVA